MSGVPSTSRSSSATACTVRAHDGSGASRCSGASSSSTGPPSGAVANAMLCTTSFRVPASLAAVMRFAVPSVRSRAVVSIASALICRNAVSWCTTTSARAARSASRTATGSRASATTISSLHAGSPCRRHPVEQFSTRATPRPSDQPACTSVHGHS